MTSAPWIFHAPMNVSMLGFWPVEAPSRTLNASFSKNVLNNCSREYGQDHDTTWPSPRRKPALHTAGGPGRRTCGDPGSIVDSGFRRNDIFIIGVAVHFRRKHGRSKDHTMAE